MPCIFKMRRSAPPQPRGLPHVQSAQLVCQASCHRWAGWTFGKGLRSVACQLDWMTLTAVAVPPLQRSSAATPAQHTCSLLWPGGTAGNVPSTSRHAGRWAGYQAIPQVAAVASRPPSRGYRWAPPVELVGVPKPSGALVAIPGTLACSERSSDSVMI
jgi:hypothetical protein